MLNLIEIDMPRFDTRIDPEAHEKYEKFKKELYEKLEYDGEQYILFGGNPHVFAKIHGRIFAAHDGNKFLHFIGSNRDIEATFPTMICRCGSDTFQVLYPNMRCTDCGITEECFYEN